MNIYTAMTAIGAEKILGNELKKLNLKLKNNSWGRVSFEGTDADVYSALLWLRTADRLFLNAAEFHCENFDELFDGVYNIEWQNLIKPNTNVILDKVRIHNSKLNSEHAVQTVSHKGIYSRLQHEWKMERIPGGEQEVSLRVHIENDIATVLLDLSGKPLHRRGYRLRPGIAPIRESVAAIMIQQSLWRRKTPLLDPFCGSGTIAIEAALYAYNIPPGIARESSMKNLAFYNKEKESSAFENALNQINFDAHHRIKACDIDAGAIKNAKINSETAFKNVKNLLKNHGEEVNFEEPEFEVIDFTRLEKVEEGALILTNPPYGQRLGDKNDALKLYAEMGKKRKLWKECEWAVISASSDFEKYFGEKAAKKRDLKSGNFDTTIYSYNEKRKKHG